MDKIIDGIFSVLNNGSISPLDKAFLITVIVVCLPIIATTLVKLRSIIFNMKEELDKKPNSEENHLLHLQRNILRNKLIQSALEKMVFEASAGKAYVIQFHNGGKNINGIPFIKFSVTNEWCPISIPKEMKEYQNIPIGIFSGLSYLAIKEGHLYFPDIEELRSKDAGSYAIFKQKGVKSVYITGIFDLTGDPIGLIILEHYESTDLDQFELEVFEKTAGIIGGLVMCKMGEDPCTCSSQLGGENCVE